MNKMQKKFAITIMKILEDELEAFWEEEGLENIDSQEEKLQVIIDEAWNDIKIQNELKQAFDDGPSEYDRAVNKIYAKIRSALYQALK